MVNRVGERRPLVGVPSRSFAKSESTGKWWRPSEYLRARINTPLQWTTILPCDRDVAGASRNLITWVDVKGGLKVQEKYGVLAQKLQH